ncbi:MAG: DNA repair protein RecN [Clostridia bacterium]|nr:DNA repair protein RecN [Clostridia bacterium]
MLKRIEIRHIALIDHAVLEFDNGLTVFSGETGAGKSILIESFGFVLGERAGRDLIRTGEQKASVEATFAVSDNDPCRTVLEENELWPEDGELVLYRELSQSGKNVCRINGVLVGTAVLKAVGDMLIDIHGQHQHQSLLSVPAHIGFLDAYAGGKVAALKEETAKHFAAYRKAEKELRECETDARERARKCDLYAYQLEEIRRAELKSGEEEELTEERDRLRHAETILQCLNESAETVTGDGGVLPALNNARKQLDRIATFGKNYASLSEKLGDIYYQLEDIGYTLRDELDGFSFEPDALDTVEERLELYVSMKRKYGDTVEEIAAYAERIASEYEALSNTEVRTENLKKQMNKALSEYAKAADALSKLRKNAAKQLETDIPRELSDLGMRGAVFTVNFAVPEGEIPSATGRDKVEFMLSANRGEPSRPLAKVASGGELSRIMLALKKTLANADGIPTMVFDEIDTGVSGAIGTAIARKMCDIAGQHQVFCITHLAQIAAYADHHFLIEKHQEGERTYSNAVCLSDAQREAEVARIMDGGADDPIALTHAKQIIASARAEKN